MAGRSLLGGLFVFLQIAFAGPAAAEPPFSMAEVLSITTLERHLHELKQGKIVSIGLPEVDSNTELKVLMSILVPAPFDDTLAALQRQANDNGVLIVEEIDDGVSGTELDTVFAKVAYSKEEIGEVKRLLDASAGAGHNFSPEEIALINERVHALGKDAVEDDQLSDAMSSAMADILKGRYISYRKKGLEGLVPYQINGNGLANPSEELTLATESLVMLRQGMPAYYRCLRNYPEACPGRIHHRFFWVKQLEGGRPMFSLKHWLLEIHPEHAVITERQFYLNHSLNSLQVVIGCQAHPEGTLVVLLNQAFTERVNVSIGKTIATSIGRMQVEKKVRPMFEQLLAQFSGNQ